MRILHHAMIVTLLLLGHVCGLAAGLSAELDSLMFYYNTGHQAIADEANYAKSLENYLRFVRLAEKSPDSYKAELMEAYSIVSIIYGAFNDFAQCLSYNEKGYALSRELGDTKYQYTCLTNMSQALIAMKRYDEAARYNEQLLQVATDDRAHLMFDYHITRGDIAQHTEQWQQAVDSWRQAMDIAEQNGFDNYRRSYPVGNLAAYYEAHHQPDSQRVYLEKAYELARSQKDPYPQINWSRALMRFYTRQGNTRQAVHYQDVYFGLTDSVMNLEEFLKISSNHGQLEIKERGQQIEHLTFTISRQRLLIYAVASTLLVLLAFFALVFRQKQRLNRAYKALFERNKELVIIEQRYHALQHDVQAATPPTTETATADVPPAATDDTVDEKADELYERILHVMENTQEYCDPNFGLARLTSLVGSNTVYVSKVIKDRLDMNVRSFINGYRIREARRRIMDQQHYGNYTIQAIAESVGYSTQVNFNRTFKKVTGITPSIYQRMMREDLASEREKTDEMD